MRVLHIDLQALTDRLDRIAHAVDLGCEALDDGCRPQVADALVDTCWEAVRLANELLRHLAYDDVWTDLPLLRHCWVRIDAQAGRVALHRSDALDVRDAARDVVDCLDQLTRAVDVLDTDGGPALRGDADAGARSRLVTALDEVEGAVDRFFVDSLGADRHGRLDAALALLTTAAARTHRLRTALHG
jgi:hypothetical protein